MSEEMEFSWNAGGQEPMDFSPMKPGKYPVCIIEVKPGHSQKGDVMMDVHCVVDDGESKGRHLWNKVTFISEGRPGAGIAVHFLKTIGEPYEIDKDFKVNARNWVGRRFTATVINDRYTHPVTMETKVTNKISGVEPITPLENKELAAKYAAKSAAVGVDYDQVPF